MINKQLWWRQANGIITNEIQWHTLLGCFYAGCAIFGRWSNACSLLVLLAFPAGKCQFLAFPGRCGFWLNWRYLAEVTTGWL